MIKLKRVSSLLLLVGFVVGGAACGSSSKTADEMPAEAEASMEQAQEQIQEEASAFSNEDVSDYTSTEAGSFDQPVEEIAQDASFQEPVSTDTYEENVSLGASSSGLGK